MGWAIIIVKLFDSHSNSRKHTRTLTISAALAITDRVVLPVVPSLGDQKRIYLRMASQDASLPGPIVLFQFHTAIRRTTIAGDAIVAIF